MKATQEKNTLNKAFLWLLIASLLVGFIAFFTIINLGEKEDLSAMNTHSITEGEHDPNLLEKELKPEIESSVEVVIKETIQETETLSSISKESLEIEDPKTEPLPPAKVIPKHQTIARLISANVENRKRRVVALIQSDRQSIAEQQAQLNQIQRELDSTSNGEKRDELLKTQQEAELELAAKENRLISREALLVKLSNKAIQYSQSGF